MTFPSGMASGSSDPEIHRRSAQLVPPANSRNPATTPVTTGPTSQSKATAATTTINARNGHEPRGRSTRALGIRSLIAFLHPLDDRRRVDDSCPERYQHVVETISFRE